MRRPLIGGEDFEASIGQGEQVQGKVMGAYQGKGIMCVCFLGGERGERRCEKKR